MGVEVQDHMEVVQRIEKILAEVPSVDSCDWCPVELGLLIAQLEYPKLNIKKEKQKFLELFDEARKEFPKELAFADQVKWVGEYFSQDLGFQGDKKNYYNVRNSFLNDVYIRRKGIPVSLTLILMGLFRRLELPAYGVAFPGHFLLMVQDTEKDGTSYFLDSFDQAKILSIEDCQDKLDAWTKGMIPFHESLLELSHPREIVSRVLRNLRAVYQEKEDLPRLYWVLTALYELSPVERLEALKERAFLHARMGRFGAAVQDLKLFLTKKKLSRKNLEHLEKMLRYFELQKDVTN